MPTRLRLKAEDIEDLGIISAMVQDAVATIGDIAYVPKTRQFALMLNRFCWERPGSPTADVRFAEVVAGRVPLRSPHERVRAGLSFGGVLRVRRQGLSQEVPEQVLSLLSISAVPGEDGAATLILTFAGAAQLRLDVECIDVRLEDLGDPWPVKRRPAHALK
jgi:hypothetical protein